jgi:hypothetical protein
MLLSPSLKGGLSTCSSVVRVFNVSPGAAVTVWTTSQAGQRSKLATLPNVPSSVVNVQVANLQVGYAVTATQADQDGEGPDSNTILVSEALPASALQAAYFPQPVYECSDCVYVTGIEAGSEISLFNGNNKLIGQAPSLDGTAVIQLSLPLTGTPTIRYQDCTGNQSPTGTPAAMITPGLVNTLDVGLPLYLCQAGIPLTGMLPGAVVTATISAANNTKHSSSACTPYQQATMVIPPLQAGDKLTLQQAFDQKCTLDLRFGSSPQTEPFPVLDESPPPPTVVAPICPSPPDQTTYVRLSGVLAPCTVELHKWAAADPTHSNPIYLGGTVVTEPPFGFMVPSLETGDTVYAIQYFAGATCKGPAVEPTCGVTVGAGLQALAQIQIVTDSVEFNHDVLWSGASVVRVTGLDVGANVTISTSVTQQYTTVMGVSGSAADILLYTPLVSGDWVVAEMWGCGAIAVSAPVLVAPYPLGAPLPNPVVAPTTSCRPTVRVTNVPVGATVVVLRNSLVLGQVATGRNFAVVPISESAPLQPGDELSAYWVLGPLYEISTPPSVLVGPPDLGDWELLDEDAQILVVHAALLPSGKVLLFGGTQYDTTHQVAPYADADSTRLWDPWQHVVTRMPSPTFIDLTTTSDVFCSGQAFMDDGRLLVAGGTAPNQYAVGSGVHHGHYGGHERAATFDDSCSEGERWSWVETMARGRWYPTLITLGTGHVLAFGGHPNFDDHMYPEVDMQNNYELRYHITDIVEALDPLTLKWLNVGRVPIGGSAVYEGELGYYMHPPPMQIPSAPTYLYPRLHVLPNGDLLSVSSLGSGTNAQGQILDSGRVSWAWTPDLIFNSGFMSTVAAATDAPAADDGYDQYTSVLLPFLISQQYGTKVLAVGSNYKGGQIPSDARAQTLDLGTPPFLNYTNAWTDTKTAMADATRCNSNAVLLPDGDVLVVGGTSRLPPMRFDDCNNVNSPYVGEGKCDSDAVVYPELFDAVTEQWSTMMADPDGIARGYHSVALLLPDGSVLVAGSSHDTFWNEDASIGMHSQLPDAPGYVEYTGWWQRHDNATCDAQAPQCSPFRPLMNCHPDARQLCMSIYYPPYLGRGRRPKIVQAPPQLRLGDSYWLEMDEVIGRVALVRCSSTTHGFSSDQRYVELKFAPTLETIVKIDVPNNENLLVPGYYMLFVLNSNMIPAIAPIVRVTRT